mmetsp:Transcript_24995/g.94487  ORF Transcript_24995/g.94487 Transcript_24995/m.94487 type:complete len:251 (+) Transcript_24995:577-1329(+)
MKIGAWLRPMSARATSRNSGAGAAAKRSKAPVLSATEPTSTRRGEPHLVSKYPDSGQLATSPTYTRAPSRPSSEKSRENSSWIEESTDGSTPLSKLASTCNAQIAANIQLGARPAAPSPAGAAASTCGDPASRSRRALSAGSGAPSGASPRDGAGEPSAPANAGADSRLAPPAAGGTRSAGAPLTDEGGVIGLGKVPSDGPTRGTDDDPRPGACGRDGGGGATGRARNSSPSGSGTASAAPRAAGSIARL